MGVTIAATRTACNVIAGNQDFTTAGCGSLTPKAVLSIVTHTYTDGTPRNDAVIAIGAASGVYERWAQSTASESGVADSNTSRRGVTDACVYKQFAPGAIDGEADIVAFITNGIRRNWSNPPGQALLLTDIFFCGSDVSAYAGTFNPNATEDDSVNVTSPGFEPDLIFFFSLGNSYDDNKWDAIWDAWGCAVNDGSETQRCAFFHSQDAQASQSVHSYFSENRISGQLASGGGGFGYTVELTAFIANGFTATTRDGAGDATDDIGYLALNFNGAASVWLDTVTLPAATGDDSVTGVGFTPQAIIQALTHMPAVATHYANASAGSRGISFVTESTQYCNAVQEEDGSATMDTQSCSDDTEIWMEKDDGAPGHTASFTSFENDGWDRNFSVNATGAVKSWAAAIEEYEEATTSTSTTTTTTTSTTTSTSTTITSTSSTSTSITTLTSTSTTTTTTSSSSTSTTTTVTSTSTSTTTTLPPMGPPLFSILHDDCDLSEYDIVFCDGGKVEASAAAALGASTCGLAVTVEDGSVDAWGEKSFVLASTVARVQARYDPNSLTMGPLDDFGWLKVYQVGTNNRIMRWATKYNAGYYLIITANDDDGTMHDTIDIAISDAPMLVDVEVIRASSSIASDGQCRVWVNNILKDTIANLDNYDIFPLMDTLEVGAITGLDATTEGTYYIDEIYFYDTPAPTTSTSTTTTTSTSTSTTSTSTSYTGTSTTTTTSTSTTTTTSTSTSSTSTSTSTTTTVTSTTTTITSTSTTSTSSSTTITVYAKIIIQGASKLVIRTAEMFIKG